MNILDPQRAINDKASDKHQLIVLTHFFQIVCQGIKIQWIMILLLKVNLPSNYTPGIYADGYIVFAFPFVRSYVR